MKWWLGIVAALCLILMPVHVHASSEQIINGNMTVDDDWTLTADTTVTGSLTVNSCDLDLNGYTLTVGGSFIQKGGFVLVNRGSLNVSGDFEQKEGYNSQLYMHYTNDTVVIGGSYRTYSASFNLDIIRGTLRIAGDLIAGRGNEYNFDSDEELQVILTGEGSHQISFLETSLNHIGNLTVESGKITVNEMMSVGKLNSDLEVSGYSGKSFTLRELNVNGHTVSFPGDVINTGNIDLEGGKLTVNGNLTQQEGIVWVNKGVLTISGDFEQKEGYDSQLYMHYTNDTVVIGGSYRTYSASNNLDIIRGTLRIAGDLIAGRGNEYNFDSDEELQVILTGQGSHQISFLEKNYSNIGNLTVESGKITANEMLSIGKLNSDLEITGYSGKNFTLRALNANGHTVSFPGDVITTGDIDLAGGKLIVNGNLIQQGGTIAVNTGALTVNGDFEQKEGYSSQLTMRNTNDIVRVEGNYATYSTASSSLSAGELTVNGDFTQGQGSSDNFHATETHTTGLTGEELQTVVFTKDGNGEYISKFNNLYINKDPKTGYRFTPDQCWNKLLGYEDVPEAEKQVRNFVSRMYTVALGRDAEEQGLKDWTVRLLSHEIDGAGIAYGFIMSGEFQSRNLNDGEYVDVLYRTFFDREADAGGRDNWLAALASGKTRGYVLSGFVNSIEFDKLCESYGIARGTMREDGSPVNAGIRQFVERCYTKVLSRAGEKAGVDDWTNRISTGQMSAEDVAKSFFFSVEYTNKNTDNETFAETLYQTFMDRASDPAGKADWVGRLNGGTSRQEVLEGFSRSAEFAGILQSYGL